MTDVAGARVIGIHRCVRWVRWPPPTRARGSWGERTRSRGSRTCSDRPRRALQGRSSSTGRRASARAASSMRRSAASAGLQEPMAVLRGGAFGPGTDAPYAPLVRALRPVLAELPDDELARVLGTATDELVRLIPELAVRVEPPGTAGRRVLTAVPERRQARLLEGVLGVLGRLGERQPVLLIIEDLHRADAGTRDARHVPCADRPVAAARGRGHLPGRRDPARGSVVGRPAPASTRRHDPPARLTLAPLGRDELARLIESIEDDAAVGERAGRRRRALRRAPAGRRGAPRGTARAADGVPHVIVPGSGPRADRRPLAGGATGAAPAGPGRAAAAASGPGIDRRSVRGRR